MQTRLLGKTGLQLPILSFGASSLGQEFRQVDVNEALRSVHVALDARMDFIDASPYYGRGMSEVLLVTAVMSVALAVLVGVLMPAKARAVDTAEASLETVGLA